MRKVILNLAVTLDGFIEGPNGEIDWCITDEEGITAHFDEFLARVDTIFYGRVSYDLWGQYQPSGDASSDEKKLWESVHSKSKYVFSTHPKESKDATYVSSGIAGMVEELKAKPGKDIWLYGGASLITTFMNLGLVDNYLLAVHPVILGGGRPLFADLKDRTNLKLNGAVTSKSGVILLDYEKV
ncbi:dihydrofolate reductase family protein [Chitinophaga sp. S165]|uniref:dihydrofolate reductase family protein n=1 Tax=Chitinophaga sp. S165 TaxID=2135462 RepID=UPI000D7142B8|nr:dihydrofolate reductase family protein [Chitinophaga sp. S165]PWV56327.1 dihydrofolate reductase [Chitinophaga sp. S165]